MWWRRTERLTSYYLVANECGALTKRRYRCGLLWLSLACGDCYGWGMDVYDHPTFAMACQQFERVADRLGVPPDQRSRIKYPKRSVTVSLPIERDDGSLEVFAGYRVQHHLTL